MKGFSDRSSVNEQFFTNLSHYGPVTSIKIAGRYIFCGYGPTLKVFEFKNNKCQLVLSHLIFKRNKIHSISVSRDGTKILVAGARSLAVIDFDMTEKTLDFKEKAVNEWIICVEFLDINTALILTSHNTVYKIDVSDMEDYKFKLVEVIHCNEKSILYSGSITVGDSKVIISAGTVMDGTIIWDLNSSSILHRLTDHKGSIFGVKVDSSFKYITSCSDDRSIKLYDFESGSLLAEGWGHGARIWNLAFFKESPAVRIFSSGEDCTARVWEYEEGNPKLKQLEVIDDCHLGKHVWSSDIDDLNDLAVTGGADGKIRLHDLSVLHESPCTYSLDHIAQDIDVRFEKSEAIKHVTELPKLNYVIALTSLGKLLILNNTTLKWSIVPLSDEESSKFVGYAVIRAFADINTIFITTAFGELLVLKFRDTTDPLEKYWIEDKYLDGKKVNNLLVSQHEDTYFVASAPPNTKIPLLVKKFQLEDGSLKLQQEFTLEQPQQTMFTTTCMVYDSINDWLIVGSRYASMMVFDLKSKTNTLFKKMSSGDTVTSISLVSSEENKLSLLVVVRDGVYMHMDISKEDDFKMTVTHQNKLTRGFLEGGVLKNGDLILYGFRSSYFYVWNETKQIEIFKELCGGAHRLWELFDYGDGEFDYKLAYINKNKLIVRNFKDRFTSNPYGLLDEGTHGREIRDIAVSPFLNNDGSRLIMTSAEDSVVRLGKIFESGKVIYNWCMKNHISGMQKVKFLSKEYAASSAANEEFFIWKLHEMKGTPLITQYASLKPSTDSPDLRVMDFDHVDTENGFLLTTVYSDSHIKLWNFDVSTKQFSLIAEDFYTSCCILNVKFITLNDELHILISATDGHIAIWNVESSRITKDKAEKLGSPIIRQQLHQNSIKGLLLNHVQENNYDLVTGGDDNALIYSKLQYEEGKIIWKSQSFIENASSSTITSVCSGGDSKAFVTSVDQIARMWDFSSGKLECLSAKYTTVADTGSSETTIINGVNLALIGGAGLSVWKY